MLVRHLRIRSSVEADALRFGINSSGVLQFNAAPDFENPLDFGNNNVYDVIVQVSDGSLADTQAISVTVLDVSATSLVVTTTADNDDVGISGYTIEQLNARGGGTDGFVSLREAIIAANSTLGANTITFNIATSDAGYVDPDSIATNGDEYWTIAVQSALPTITDRVTINAATQPTYAGTPVIELNGAATTGAAGLRLNLASSSQSEIRGFAINQFHNGLQINGNSASNIIAGNYIGTDVTGTLDLGNLNVGVTIFNGINNSIGGPNLADRNIISGNNNQGIVVNGPGSSGNVIINNYIGTDRTGTIALGNSAGIWLGSAGTTIGQVGAGNLISGNNTFGINGSTSASGTVIQSNLIGTSASGNSDLGNGEIGIAISSNNNRIGTDSNGTNDLLERNVISGNDQSGVLISGDNNIIAGNFIGTNATGTAAIANTLYGVYIESGTGNIVGGTTAASQNVISGNAVSGVVTATAGAIGNTIQGNLIGTNVTGTGAIGNGQYGVYLFAGSSNTVQSNTISHNDKGIVVASASSGNRLLENILVGNTTIAIDLNNDGVTSNDGALSGANANDSMDSPTITVANLSGNTLSLDGFVGLTAGDTDFANARVEFFKETSGAAVFLGFLTTDANGLFSGSLTVSGLTVTDNLVATATSSSGSTSELGVIRDVNAPVVIANNVNTTLLEGSTGNVITTAMLRTTDADNTDAQLTYTVTAIPTNGTLRRSGVALSANGTFTQADIAAGLITYDHNGSETVSDTFNFSVSDNNGSTATGQFIGTITPVNDAPTLTNGATMNMSGTNEDASSPANVSTLLFAGGYADADAGALSGVAITGTAGNGAWQYSTDGLTWNNIGTVSEASSLLLMSTSRVRFVGDTLNGETATFTYKAWDQTTGTASTNTVRGLGDASINGGTTAYSAATANGQIVITSVNDAPVLTANSLTLSLTEDTAPFSLQVGTLFDTSITDVDTGALKGIALTGVAGHGGTILYSTNNGATWTTISAPSPTSSILLRSNDLLQFVPDSSNGGSLSLSYRGWDRTSGTAGGTANTTVNGGITAFSTALNSLTVNMSDVNRRAGDDDRHQQHEPDHQRQF